MSKKGTKAIDMEIVKKAYSVWHEGMLNENPHLGYTMDSLPVVYADSPGEAKTKASEPYDFEIDGESHKYCDLRARREKEADLVMFEGEETSKRRMKSILSERKRIEERRKKIESYPDNALFYIQNGYVGNDVLWWARNSNGYVCDITKAQLYPKAEVLRKFVEGRVEDKIWESNHVMDNIKQVVDAQYLKSEFVS